MCCCSSGDLRYSLPDLLSRPLKKAQDQNLGHQVSRPRPRPWPPGLKTKTKTLVIRSRDQNLIIGHKYLCMCVYMYVCLYEGMCICYIHNVCMYICIYACRCISSQSYLS